MPTNSASAARCTIKLITPPPPSSTSAKPTKTACEEYSQQSIKDPITGAFKEIVTIESKQSSRFQISFQVDPTAYALLERSASNPPSSTETAADGAALKPSDYLVEVLLDGVSIGAYHQHRAQTARPHNLHAFRSSETTTRLLQFAPLHLVDPDDYPQVLDHVGNPTHTEQLCQDEDIIRSLGMIEVKITRCELSVKTRAPSIKQVRARQTTTEMNFSESIKKARLSSTVGLGQPTLDERKKDKVSYRVHSKDPNPFLHFIFKYKPRSILIAEGILPSPIIPEQLPGEGASTEKQELDQPKPNSTETRITIESSDSEPERKEDKVGKIIKEKHKKKTLDKKDENDKGKVKEGSGRRNGNCKKKRRAGEEEEQEGENGKIDQKRRRLSAETDQKPVNPNNTQTNAINPSQPITIIKQDIKPAQPGILIDLTL